jgi:hypothetical protein
MRLRSRHLALKQTAKLSLNTASLPNQCSSALLGVLDTSKPPSRNTIARKLTEKKLSDVLERAADEARRWRG